MECTMYGATWNTISTKDAIDQDNCTKSDTNSNSWFIATGSSSLCLTGVDSCAHCPVSIWSTSSSETHLGQLGWLKPTGKTQLAKLSWQNSAGKTQLENLNWFKATDSTPQLAQYIEPTQLAQHKWINSTGSIQLTQLNCFSSTDYITLSHLTYLCLINHSTVLLYVMLWIVQCTYM